MQQGVEQRIDADEDRYRVFPEFGDEGRDIARVGDQQIGSAKFDEGEAIRGQREDVIQRQRRDDKLAPLTQLRLDPGIGLCQIGENIAMRQHGAFRQTGRAAGVLQKGEIFLLDCHR